ncbi:hypothetical protein [Cylindrospermopsis raciborskii]|uniref:Uncharacterized protein n=1 Tax=Cylindrospermopsis raciborskii CS-506_A TaxID=2585140 RepID=A0A838WN78_9CYAN|nr:hypothetical protein [Cylindrospermopsis raciborskii]MBA4445984.1 hypothetical protein [Cylindrospermopsis raciborskii CS-506_C]MBA4466195.1 hypothetical protein [Cylindrospermopsis raciborskii CS-506_A]
MRSHVPIFSIGSAVLTGDSKPNGRSPVPISSQGKLANVFYQVWWFQKYRQDLINLMGDRLSQFLLKRN